MHIMKEHQLVVLPTDKPSQISLFEGKLSYHLHNVTPRVMDKDEMQHVYILYDEEIKEGDWYLRESIQKTFVGAPVLAKLGSNRDSNSSGFNSYCKKIIATTNPDLNGQVHQISTEFLKQWVKNPIDKVVVQYDIIISTPNPKKTPFFEGYTLSAPELKVNEDYTINCSPIINDWDNIINEWLKYYSSYTNGQGLKMTEWLKENYNAPISKK